jgi:hypothetical protein
MRFHLIQNNEQFKTYELFVSGLFHEIFLAHHHSWPQVTEMMENKIAGKGV